MVTLPPFLYETLTHYSAPVYPDAPGGTPALPGKKLFCVGGRDFPVSGHSYYGPVMKLVSIDGSVAGQDPATETIFLSQRHASFLAKMSGEINPEMPKAFGWPHAIRTILDRIEESNIDLTVASSEYEIAQLAAGELRAKGRRRTATSRA